MENFKSRADINGLRAIAVIAVVLFHFNSSWLPGGFAGVDVFFVISGFLMTGIIFKGLDQDNFSILKFYVARAKRIIPALAILCLVLLVFCWFFLTPSDYSTLGKHVGSSVVFLSNIVYWRESGYFDAASHEKWLLHTWSLSVEWQFYVVYPLVLIAMKKIMSLNAMKVTVFIGAILGFIFCLIITYKWPNSAYYLLPTRAWEMMIGGVAFLYPLELKENKKKFLELLGLALIVLSYIFISENSPWPGYFALFPVLGSFLLIQAQRRESIITGNVFFQKLGKWSYSIYLWHWPLVVILAYFDMTDLSLLCAFLMLSLVLGFFSYKFIEQKKWSYKGIMMIVTLQLSVYFILNNQEERPSYTFFLKSIEKEADLFQNVYSHPDCNFRSLQNGEVDEGKENIEKSCYEKPVGKSIFLYGDSHVQHLRSGLDHYFGENISLLQIATFSCQIQMIGYGKKGCIKSNQLFWDEIENVNPNVLIISQNSGYEDVNWGEVLSSLDYISNIIILGPSALYTGFFKYQLDKVNKPFNYDYIKSTDSIMLDLVGSYENVEYISAYDGLCSDKGCDLVIDNSFAMLADGSHFTREYSQYFIKMKLNNRLLNILKIH